MGDSKFVLRVKKVKSQLLITASGQHNFRETVSNNVDSSRSYLNENLGKSKDSQGLSELIDTLTADENLKKDAKSTKVMEFIISASPEQLSSESFDDGKYFRDAVKWAESLHGAENVVSVMVHRDEDTPHIHILVVPINKIEATTRNRSVQVKGAKVGVREIKAFVVPVHRSLSANVRYGGPSKMSEMQTSFEQTVGKPHGLYRDQRYFSGQEYKKEGYVSPRKFHQELIEREKGLAVKEKAVEALRANLADELTAEKMYVAETRQYMDLAAAKLVDLDQRSTVLDDGFKKLAVDKDTERAFLVKIRNAQDAEKEKVVGREVVVSGRETTVTGREVAVKDQEAAVIQQAVGMTQLAKDRDVQIVEVKATLGAWEKQIDLKITSYLDKTKNFTDDQIVAGIERNLKDSVKPADVPVVKPIVNRKH